MPRKSNKIQAHGKKVTETFQPSNLDEIVMGSKAQVYATQDLNEYIAYLRSLDLADLKIHARKVGLIGSTNRVQVERELISRFRAHIFSAPPKKNAKKYGLKEDQELYKLLESGR